MILLVLSLFLLNSVSAVCKTDLNSNEQAALDAHNALRAKHEDTNALCYGESGSDVTFSTHFYSSDDPTDEATAGTVGELRRTYARSFSCDFCESDEIGPYAINKWYAEGAPADLNTTTGNGYTQILWKNTTQVECGFMDLGKQSFKSPVTGQVYVSYRRYAICQYYPPGNVEGAFAANVGAEIPEEEEEEEDNNNDNNSIFNNTSNGSASGLLNGALVLAAIIYHG